MADTTNIVSPNGVTKVPTIILMPYAEKIMEAMKIDSLVVLRSNQSTLAVQGAIKFLLGFHESISKKTLRLLKDWGIHLKLENGTIIAESDHSKEEYLDLSGKRNRKRLFFNSCAPNTVNGKRYIKAAANKHVVTRPRDAHLLCCVGSVILKDLTVTQASIIYELPEREIKTAIHKSNTMNPYKRKNTSDSENSEFYNDDGPSGDAKRSCIRRIVTCYKCFCELSRNNSFLTFPELIKKKKQGKKKLPTKVKSPDKKDETDDDSSSDYGEDKETNVTHNNDNYNKEVNNITYNNENHESVIEHTVSDNQSNKVDTATEAETNSSNELEHQEMDCLPASKDSYNDETIGKDNDKVEKNIINSNNPEFRTYRVCTSPVSEAGSVDTLNSVLAKDESEVPGSNIITNNHPCQENMGFESIDFSFSGFDQPDNGSHVQGIGGEDVFMGTHFQHPTQQHSNNQDLTTNQMESLNTPIPEENLLDDDIIFNILQSIGETSWTNGFEDIVF